MPRPRLIPEDLYPEILARSGKRESSDSIAVWVSEKIGKNVNGRTVRLMLAQVRKERAPLAKQIVTEELSKTLTADLQAVEDLLADIKKHQVRAEKVEDLIAEAERIGKADPLKIMGPNGTILALDKIEENTRRAIASVKVFEEFEGQGDARVKTGENGRGEVLAQGLLRSSSQPTCAAASRPWCPSPSASRCWPSASS
jgi:hypothetical protein